jgi:hypothetical protein
MFNNLQTDGLTGHYRKPRNRTGPGCRSYSTASGSERVHFRALRRGQKADDGFWRPVSSIRE